MCFDPFNHSLKIRESIRTLILKMGIHLGVWVFIRSHSPTLPRTWDVTPELPSWPSPLQALALVVSSRLGLWHVLVYHQQMGSGWTSVPFVHNMNRLQFQHLGFLLKPIYGVELTIFHLNQILTSLVRCFCLYVVSYQTIIGLARGSTCSKFRMETDWLECFWSMWRSCSNLLNSWSCSISESGYQIDVGNWWLVLKTNKCCNWCKCIGFG
jgi:hypothetical protein